MLITPQRAAALLCLSRRQVYNLIGRRELPHYRMGRAVRLDSADVEAYRDGCRVGRPLRRARDKRVTSSADPCLRVSDAMLARLRRAGALPEFPGGRNSATTSSSQHDPAARPS